MKARFVLSLVLVLVAGTAAAESPPIRIGVLAYRGADHVMRSWSATADYLTAQVPGRRFEIVPLPLVALRESAQAGGIDYVLTNPGQYVVLEEALGLSRIVTLKKPFTESLSNVFGAVIFVSVRSDIHSLKQLKGKVFGAVAENAFGGFQMAWRELKAAGIDPFKALNEVRFFGLPQDDIVLAVRDGAIDAGTVRTGVLETMAREGVIKLDDFRVLDKRQVPDGRLMLSTRLYPEWPLAKMPHVSAELSEQVAIALMKLGAASPEMRAAGASGWTVPLDYKPVHDLFRELEIGPYARGEVGVADILRRHWEWVLFASVLLVLIVLHGIRTEYLVQRRTRELSHEIQERRAAEDRARQHEAELAHVSRINVIGEMTSGLAHELRQPLAAIRNYAEGGLRRLQRGSLEGDEAGEALTAIAEQAGRAAKIISRVRGYMQKREPRRAAVDINQVVRESAGFVRSDARAAAVEVALALSQPLPPVQGDLIELEQLVINLCRNAIEAMAGSPGRRRVEIETAAADGGVEITVADSGPGMAPERLETIWQPFMTTKERGLGLGLAISRSIVDAHGGRIRAANGASPGQDKGGLRVTVWIPAGAEAKIAAGGGDGA
ncbi:MAG: PhnD/SsuA/transferrin family substrate-binding protein [Rhodospirillaceae bacterium]